jgi:hypothetical protein
MKQWIWKRKPSDKYRTLERYSMERPASAFTFPDPSLSTALEESFVFTRDRTCNLSSSYAVPLPLCHKGYVELRGFILVFLDWPCPVPSQHLPNIGLMLVTIILDGGREVSILQKKSEQVKSFFRH